jgi:hypothetical protein
MKHKHTFLIVLIITLNNGCSEIEPLSEAIDYGSSGFFKKMECSILKTKLLLS